MNSVLGKAVFANGCFWCTEAVFQRLRGVTNVLPGFTGGVIKNPPYREICQGRTGHAEAIEITFNPKIISYTTLLEVFFATHDPTTLNRQGNDVGTQYRSEIFYTSEIQQTEALAFIIELEKASIFNEPIVTKISPLGAFYYAEQDHQDFYNLHKDYPYCQFIINPKINKIKKYYADKLK